MLRSPATKSLVALNQSADHIHSNVKALTNNELQSLSRDKKKEDQDGIIESREFPKLTKQQYEREHDQYRLINQMTSTNGFYSAYQR